MKLRNCGLLIVLALLAFTVSGCAGSGDDLNNDDPARLPQLLLSSFGDAGRILGSITDSTSAQNAVPQLQGVGDVVDDLILESGNSSPDVKMQMSNAAAGALPGLQKSIASAYAIPGVESAIKSYVDSLVSKYKSF